VTQGRTSACFFRDHCKHRTKKKDRLKKLGLPELHDVLRKGKRKERKRGGKSKQVSR
jgi:hypothetical protein